MVIPHWAAEGHSKPTEAHWGKTSHSPLYVELLRKTVALVLRLSDDIALWIQDCVGRCKEEIR